MAHLLTLLQATQLGVDALRLRVTPPDPGSVGEVIAQLQNRYTAFYAELQGKLEEAKEEALAREAELLKLKDSAANAETLHKSEVAALHAERDRLAGGMRDLEQQLLGWSKKQVEWEAARAHWKQREGELQKQIEEKQKRIDELMAEVERERQMRIDAESRRSRVFKPIRAGSEALRLKRPLTPFEEKIDFMQVRSLLRRTSLIGVEPGSRASVSGIPPTPTTTTTSTTTTTQEAANGSAASVSPRPPE